jgi:hypothetical protein
MAGTARPLDGFFGLDLGLIQQGPRGGKRCAAAVPPGG